MGFREWNVLSFLNSVIDPYLSCDSTSLDIYRNLIVLCELVLLLLLLWYLVSLPFSPTFSKTKDIRKRQGRAKRRRKGGTPKGWRCHQTEIEEKTKLISILKSLLGQHDDNTRIHRLLCPDPFCEVCNNATAEINRLLLPGALEDSASSVSPLASTAPVTESSFTLSPAFSTVPPRDLTPASLLEPSPLPPSVLSPSPMTPLVDSFSPSPLGHSLAPEPFPSLDSKFPVDYSPPQPLAFPPLLPHDSQTADPVLPREATLSPDTVFSLDPTLSQDINPLSDLSQAMNHPDSFACHHAPPTLMSLSPQPECTLSVTQSVTPEQENLSPDSSGGLSTCVSTIRGTEHSSLSIADFSWRQAHAKDSFPSTLAQCDFNQEFLDLHSSEASFGGDPAANLVEPGNLSFLSPDVLAFLERQVQKRSDFLMCKEKENEKDSFPEQLRPDYQRNSSWKMLESTADKHDSAVCLPFWSSRDKSEELHVRQQPPYPKTLEDHLQQKPIQFFWGLPSLHSESLPSAVHVLADSSSIFIFNRNSNASTGQESPVLPDPLPLSLPEIQPEPLPQTLPQSQPLPLTQVQSQADPHDKGEMQRGKKVEKSEPVSMPRLSREVFAAEEPDPLQIKTSDMVTTSKVTTSSQMINVNENKAETTVTTGSPPPKLPVRQDPKSLDLKEQLFRELNFKLENREHSQAQGQPTDTSLASDNLTYEASLTHAQGVSGGDMGASQVLHVHFEDRGIRMEQQQKPWAPKQDKNFPPTAKRVSPLEPKVKELDGGDKGLGTSQLRKSFPTQEKVLGQTRASKSSQTLSQKGQPLPEGHNGKRMMHFLQWLYSGIKYESQEDAQEKGSPISTVQNRGLVKSKAAFTGTTEAQKIVTDNGKFLEEKLGCQHAIDVTCSQGPRPPPVQVRKTQQKAEVQVRTEPVQGHPVNYRAPSCKVTNVKSCHQISSPTFAGQSYPPSTRQIRDKKRHPQTVVAFKDQQLCHRHLPPVSHGEPVPHPSPTHRCQAGQAPTAALSTAEGTVFGHRSLLFRQKTILQNSQGGRLPIQK
ncbi:hypothetical protein DBR06_SOUSAS7810007 [Sousa chinensis]|nr:hypothetical protein DBR06_SOUSAS7810007 [Sousa chinensis]